MITTKEQVRLEGNENVYAVGGSYWNGDGGVAYFDIYVLGDSVNVPDSFEVRGAGSCGLLGKWYLGSKKWMSQEIINLLISAGYQKKK